MKDKASVFRDAILLGLILVLSALVVVWYWRGEKQGQEIAALRGEVGTLRDDLQTTKGLLQSTRDEAASIAYVREMGERANSIIGGLDRRLGENETLAKGAGARVVAAENQLKELEKRVKKLEDQ
jgi:hypothetical protein